MKGGSAGREPVLSNSRDIPEIIVQDVIGNVTTNEFCSQERDALGMHKYINKIQSNAP